MKYSVTYCRNKFLELAKPVLNSTNKQEVSIETERSDTLRINISFYPFGRRKGKISHLLFSSGWHDFPEQLRFSRDSTQRTVGF